MEGGGEEEKGKRSEVKVEVDTFGCDVYGE
jgi:hypothetical protein